MPDIKTKNPPWQRDELILALSFYMAHRARIPDKTSGEIATLSREVNAVGRLLHPTAEGTFRNTNGVYMKLMNFRRLDPAYTATGGVGLSRGGRADEEVWNELAADLSRVQSAAEAIRRMVTQDGLAAEVSHSANAQDEPDVADAFEGRLLTRLHRYRERSVTLVRAKKGAALSAHGRLACEACGFDFKERYGVRGADFIECHHVKPVSTLAVGQKTRLEDLALVCANCHRMIHTGAPWLRACLRRCNRIMASA